VRAAAASLLLAGALGTASPCRAGCEDVAKALFGVGPGPMAGYVGALRPGLHREGTARLVPDVGFESLSGQAGDVTWERILAFDDHGRFYAFVAVGSIPGEGDHGFAAIVRQVAQAAALPPRTAGDKASFTCAEPWELAVEAKPTDRGPRVTVTLTDVAARAAAQGYVRAWCADPAHQAEHSACAR
jgi:hypothetical protein